MALVSMPPPTPTTSNRSAHADCLVEKNVNAVMVDTMAAAATLLATRFSKIKLDQIAPRRPVAVNVHAQDRKSVVQGKSVSVSVSLGGCAASKKKNTLKN